MEADGKLYRNPRPLSLRISSGIDWFELHGSAEFGDSSIALPRLLTALRRQEHTILLDDGSFGILPEEWLQKYGMLADLGTAVEILFASGAARRGCSTPWSRSTPEWAPSC